MKKAIVFDSNDFEVSMERIQEIKNRCHSISSSPWVWTLTQNEKGQNIVDVIAAKPGYVGSGETIATVWGNQAFTNAEFITHAEGDMRHLISHLEYLLGLINSTIPKSENAAGEMIQ
jgi:hypothetical protein